MNKKILPMLILAALAGISTRIIFYFVLQEAAPPVMLVFGIFPFTAAYFVINNAPKRSIINILGALFLFSAFYLGTLPLEQSDSTLLAYLHLPVFLWILVGLAYTGNECGTGSARLAYLKFNGEFCILYASMAISGMLLTMITLQLFQFVGMDIAEFYFRNVVLIGAAALWIVAAHFVLNNLKLSKSLAPYIAKIFSPLVLATLLTYLLTAAWIGKNPFLDRNFLISFNGILLCVLAITIFSITESSSKDKKSISDYINFALIILALIVDIVALAAMAFRLSSYGITPNRLAVLGLNVMIFGNLLWIMRAYMHFLKGKAESSAIQDAITKYLPFYGLWAAFVAFTFPLIFSA